MKLFQKNTYKSRFFGYNFIKGIVLIIDGIFTILLGPFNISSNLLEIFCLWNLKKDMKVRSKKKVEKEETVLGIGC